ncbi:MAG: glycosyltransferase [Lachnospiraceae bacterium]|nr:glycosyltransferase [Lachnospiraceae bacterium]
MNILVVNLILFTPDKGVIPCVNTIKDTMIHSLCSGLTRVGNKVTLAASEEYRPLSNETYEFDIKFFKSTFPSLFKPSLIPFPTGLRDFLLKHGKNYDLIISSEVFSMATLIASRVCPEKLIVWQEMSMHQKKFFKIPSKIWHNFILKIFMNKIRLIVPRSDYAKKFIKRYSSSVSEDIVEHGIDIDKFLFSNYKKRQFISSSQLIPRKNVEGIILKFKQFHELPQYADVKLLIAGRGEMESKLRSMVEELDMSECVNFLGFISQKELNTYIRESMGFLVNTRQDLNIVSIPESIVSGTPIVTNSVPSSINYIKDNKLGIVNDNWGSNELAMIVDNNEEYVQACRIYRDELTNIGVAQKFMCIWNKIK